MHFAITTHGLHSFRSRRVINRAGIEKADIHKNGVILGDKKCLGGPRKSFVRHPDAT
jgi:hypothetical protein